MTDPLVDVTVRTIFPPIGECREETSLEETFEGFTRQGAGAASGDHISLLRPGERAEIEVTAHG